MGKKLIIILLIVVSAIGVFAWCTHGSSNRSSSYQSSNGTYSIKFGQLLSAVDSNDEGEILVIKTKITPSYSNDATIKQNYYNVADIIKNQGGDKFNSIDYWAVADMDNGKESKIVSFIVDKNTINMIHNGQIVDNELGNYVTDLWVHQSLK